MAEENDIRKLAEARKGKETKLVAVWTDKTLSECTGMWEWRKTVLGQETTQPDTYDCENKPTDIPAVKFFERLGNLAREGYDVRVLYDSETVVSEMGELGSLREGRL